MESLRVWKTAERGLTGNRAYLDVSLVEARSGGNDELGTSRHLGEQDESGDSGFTDG
jgi:hypothetical protein